MCDSRCCVQGEGIVFKKEAEKFLKYKNLIKTHG
jgi:hypothetical protein